MYGYGMNWGWMAFGWLMPLLLLVVIIYIFSGVFSGKKSPSAKEILDKRYAEGDIGTEEYKERLKELEASENL